MLTLKEIGPQVNGNEVVFSLYLPSIVSPQFTVYALSISKQDQFDKDVPAQRIPLAQKQIVDSQWGKLDKGLWCSQPITFSVGTYLYRYEIRGPSKKDGQPVRSLYFGDPFAHETSSGVFSVFHIGAETISITDPARFRVPAMNDAIIYEINVEEFNYTFDGIRERIPYLKSLGINVLEMLPITGISEPSNWGYTPIFYIAPEERFGGPAALKKMVEACHQAGIAVIMDLVAPHSDRQFPYQIGYDRFFDLWFDNEYVDLQTNQIVRSPNPLVSAYERFGKKNDFRLTSTMEFFKAVCEYWIEEYHIDGFRFDHVNGFLDTCPIRDGNLDWDRYRPCFDSVKDLTNHLYQFSKRFPRFQAQDGTSRIIQIAEDLNQGSYQLSNISGSAINGCWEESIYYASTDMTKYDCLNGSYANELLLSDSRWNNVMVKKQICGEDVVVSPVLYNNCHDKSYLMYRITNRNEWDPTGFDYSSIDNWPKLQPYAIALLTGVGTPMLWAGEEFAESYGIPGSGSGRVRGTRFLHWENFYTQYEMTDVHTVLPLTMLYRNLCAIRNAHQALRGPRQHAKKEIEDFGRKVIVFRRWLGNEIIVVALNFSDSDKLPVDIPLGHAGNWRDILDQKYNKGNGYIVHSNYNTEWVRVEVPSNFGRILLLE